MLVDFSDFIGFLFSFYIVNVILLWYDSVLILFGLSLLFFSSIRFFLIVSVFAYHVLFIIYDALVGVFIDGIGSG